MHRLLDRLRAVAAFVQQETMATSDVRLAVRELFAEREREEFGDASFGRDPNDGRKRVLGVQNDEAGLLLHIVVDDQVVVRDQDGALQIATIREYLVSFEVLEGVRSTDHVRPLQLQTNERVEEGGGRCKPFRRSWTKKRPDCRRARRR